jgi:hypothetical protein
MEVGATSYPARAHTRLPQEAGGPLACAGDALGERPALLNSAETRAGWGDDESQSGLYAFV